MKNVFVSEKSFYKRYFDVAMPIIAQNVITIGVNMMDTIMLGDYGEVQLSASSLANDYINIFQILCMGMGCGAAVLTAQYWGQKNLSHLKKTVALMLRVAAVISLLFTLSVIFFPSQIMSIYTNEADIVEKGALYFTWSIPTFFITGITMTLTQVMRSVREVKVPLFASIVGFFANIFFNWVFIFGHFGMPEMQIAGAALGTVIARCFEAAIIGVSFFVKDEKIGFKVKDLFEKAEDVGPLYVKYCIPVIASDSLLGFGNTAVSIIVGHMGTAFTAAYAIIAVIQRLATVITSGMGQSAHTLTGNRIGEGKKELAYREALTMLLLTTVMGLFAAVVIRLAGPYIVGFYEIQEETYETAMLMLDAVSIMIVFQAMQSVITKGVLRGGGDTGFCLMIDAVFLWIVSVPLGWYTGLVLHCNAFIVFLSLKADWAIKSIIGTIRVISGKWIRDIQS